MKEGWRYVKLCDCCDFRSGFAFKSNLFTTSGQPIIRISDIQNEMVDERNMVFFEPSSYKEDLSKYIIYPDDILIAMSGGTTGKIGINKTNKCFYLNQRVGVFRENEKLLQKKYLFYFLHTKSEESLKIAAGAAQPNLSTAQIKDFKLPLPPLSEQQSIVSYLDSSFAKIDAMKVNAEKALDEAKALFQATLKEMLEPKEGWEEKTLGEICRDVRYGTSTPSNENGEYKYLRMNNITNDGFLDISHYKTISLSEQELSKCLVKKGDIIFNRTNSRELVGKSCVFTSDEPMVIAGYLIRIRLNSGFEPQFITYYMNMQRLMGKFLHLIVGAVHQANISAKNIQKSIINFPPLSEQQSIVTTLDTLKSKVDSLQANYDKISQECDALKQAILRQVFE